MKISLHHFFVLAIALLCVGAVFSLAGKSSNIVDYTIDNKVVYETECSIRAADWQVSTAENRISTHSCPNCKTDEDNTKRKKQRLILAVFSHIKFSTAKTHSINESLTTKRKVSTVPISTVNRQLRL
ncbi:MAG: hypothetical protein ACO1PI_14410 [Bacteroidota bacterium]